MREDQAKTEAELRRARQAKALRENLRRRKARDSASATSFALLGAQRHCKVIGIFTRLDRRDRKPRYLAHIPRLWRLLERNLEVPALAPLEEWLDRNIPQELRQMPEAVS